MNATVNWTFQHIVDNSQQFQYQPYHERFIVQNAHKLDKNRIDAFLFTKNSTIYELKQKKEWHKYRLAGCVSQEKIYIAFTPINTAEKDVEAMIEVFEKQMKRLKATGYITLLMKNMDCKITQRFNVR